MPVAVHEHKKKAAKSLGIMVITVSDTRDQTTDQSGQLIKEMLAEGGHRTVGYQIVKDEPKEIEDLLRQTLGRKDLEVIILNGGGRTSSWHGSRSWGARRTVGSSDS